MSDTPFSAESVAAALVRASNDIRREVGALIPVAADQMASILTSRYPIGRTDHPVVPHMRDQVRVSTRQGDDPLLPVRKVKAPNLATIWQDGTAERFDPTRGNARRGRMPAAAPGFFERTAVAVRAAMLQRAQAVLDKPRSFEGQTVGGSGGSLL
jgi:hypothetical protein